MFLCVWSPLLFQWRLFLIENSVRFFPRNASSNRVALPSVSILDIGVISTKKILRAFSAVVCSLTCTDLYQTRGLGFHLIWRTRSWAHQPERWGRMVMRKPRLEPATSGPRVQCLQSGRKPCFNSLSATSPPPERKETLLQQSNVTSSKGFQYNLQIKMCK